MDVLAKQVNGLLKNQYELDFQYDEEKAEFYFSIDMNHVCLGVRIICREADKQTNRIKIIHLYLIDKTKYSRVLVFLYLDWHIRKHKYLFINENCN